MDWMTQYCEMAILSKSIKRFYAFLIKVSVTFFRENFKN